MDGLRLLAMRQQICNDFVSDTGCPEFCYICYVTLSILKYVELLTFPCAGITTSKVDISEFSALFGRAYSTACKPRFGKSVISMHRYYLAKG